jgi:hypothetical protein
VDHEFRGQRETGRDSSLSGRTANSCLNFRYRLARCEELRSGSSVDGAVNAATTKHPLICCVDDRIHFNFRDIGNNDG